MKVIRKRPLTTAPDGVTGRAVPAVVLLLLALLLSACDRIILPNLPDPGTRPAPAPGPGTPTVTRPRGGLPRSATPVPGDWYDIYFTSPNCPPEAERTGGIDELVAEDMLKAQQSVDIAAYDLDALPIVEALIQLELRQIPVRVVTDTDNEDLSSIRRLRRNGISVVTDKRSAIMHNKFVVIDEQVVWMGSMNFTSNGAHCNNNNLVRFDAPTLAANYRAEMDEMYEQRSFGPRSPLDTPSPILSIGGVRVENYFAPEEKVAPIIGDLVAEAQKSIYFMAFSFTHEEIGEAMLERAEAGVTVEGVFERVGSETAFSYYPVMRDAGIENLRVLQDGNSGLMHHKVIIIDSAIVIFGSFNFTGNANNSNDENVVIMHDPAFAAAFEEEFGFVWGEAELRAARE